MRRGIPSTWWRQGWEFRIRSSVCRPIRSFFVSKRAKERFANEKEWREQIAKNRSLRRAILRERAKSKWAKERIPNPGWRWASCCWRVRRRGPRTRSSPPWPTSSAPTASSWSSSLSAPSSSTSRQAIPNFFIFDFFFFFKQLTSAYNLQRMFKWNQELLRNLQKFDFNDDASRDCWYMYKLYPIDK